MLNRGGYLEKYMDHTNNGTYQLFKRDPTTKLKYKTFRQLKALKDKKLIDNKLYYYLKPTDSPVVRSYGQKKYTITKIHIPGVPLRSIVSFSGSQSS